MMDALVDQAAGYNVDSLRGLGATAGITLSKFERFLELAEQPDPESPALSTLRNALRLFIDSFNSDATGRLVTVSRPALIAAVPDNFGASDEGQQRLLRIVQFRGRLAFALDCFLGCDCEPGQILCQVVFDKLLYDTDRAIDLYLQSNDGQGDGPAEQRAAAFGVLMWLLVDTSAKTKLESSQEPEEKSVGNTLRKLQRHCSGFGKDNTPPDPSTEPYRSLSALAKQLLIKPFGEPPDIIGAFRRTEPAKRMQSELCMQRRNEARWLELAQAMTSGCIDLGRIGEAIDDLLAAGLGVLGVKGMSCPDLNDSIPPDPATSLAGLAYLQPSDGSQMDDSSSGGDS